MSRRKFPVAPHLAKRPTPPPVANPDDLDAPNWGSRSYVLTFATHERVSGKHDLDLSIISTRPELADPFCDYVFQWGIGKTCETRENIKRPIRLFERFTSGYEKSFGIDIDDLSQYTSNFVDNFLKWLEGRFKISTTPFTKSDRLSDITIKNDYNRLKKIFSWIGQQPRYASSIGSGPTFKRNVKSGAHRKIKNFEPLADAQIAAIRAACFRSLDASLAKLDIGLGAVAEGTLSLKEIAGIPNEAFQDLSLCLRALAAVEREGLSWSEVEQKLPSFARRIRTPHHTKFELRSYLHFTPTSLVPIVLLVDMQSHHNKRSILGGKWADVSEVTDIDPDGSKTERKRFAPEKNRSRRRQPRTFSMADAHRYSPAKLLSMVREYTGNTRELVPASEYQNIFLCAKRNWGLFGTLSTVFDHALEDFCKEAGLEPFTLAQLRATGSDKASLISGGDIRAQSTAMGHPSSAMTHNSYLSPGARMRLNEALADLMGYMDRWAASGGKIDLRGKGLTGAERSAATPGFLCADPYFSPLPDQRAGRLCRAYGRCAACALGLVDRSDPRAYFRLLQLRERLVEARSACDPSRWSAHWQPQLEALEGFHLHQFDISVVEQALGLSLGPIPPLE
jgi:integrase